MKAVLLKDYGDPANLYIGDYETPRPKPTEILVRVEATALNRADTMQRRGQYPPPPGASPILGLELAGEVTEIGSQVSKWKKGDKVCSLLAGGGYAEYAVVPESLALPIPEGMSISDAAGIPEVFMTAYQALCWIAKIQKNEKTLIHAGASGVGTAALQIARAIGATSYVTASKGKHGICLKLGATAAIDYKTEDFELRIKELTEGVGVNVIIDFIAAPYFQQNLNSLTIDGRLVILALMGGIKVKELNMVNFMFKRLQVFGSTLRARSLDYKARLASDLQEFAWTRFESGEFHSVIDSVYDWKDVAEAHRYMEANNNQGKIILQIS